MSENDAVARFLSHAQQICTESQFIIDSLPNVKRFSIERSLRQLNAIHLVLANFDDPWISSERRLWRDVRRDTIEAFRQIFMYLEENDLLDMDSDAQQLALYLVYQPRIQRSLDETLVSWNQHKVRTAGNKSPVALYELSKEKAMNQGYWADPGDDVEAANDPLYGHDPSEPVPPEDDLHNDPQHSHMEEELPDTAAEREAGLFVNADDEIQWARDIIGGMDLERDDGNWGIDLYCQAVVLLSSHIS
ncbi:hypothetical protein OE88DRAFT_1630323 [Heliocybe sulcata]|uniref:Integrase core domain-containing protein n=1 Tax=Heliocybe sulcata TaxID=5364 RepID=A0A5C3N387_9AGAM|nr:hypothetical protein OE88DRAFT_1630323 [Heliocybe sulcata]